MLFNSLEFLLFLPTVFYFYWFAFHKNHRVQNLVLLISSYVFYGWWDYRFLSLIIFSTVLDYLVGLRIYYSNDIRKKKYYLWISILFNLGLLGFFKYFNFFIDSWIFLLNSFGYGCQSTWTLKVILPVGLSFYTFQTMSYSLDIYFKKIKPTKDFISFASFVSFFPQLVAGPIERASTLLPQILRNRVFTYEQGVEGLKLILYGMFKKVVIADSLAPYVDNIFQNYLYFNGGELLLGLIYFSFQIYCDFSGYSDIAIGTSKLFGFELLVNFKFPYFSRDIGELWRRWHISLSTWLRDYLYIPLGGSKVGKWLVIRNIFIIFVVSGFWHGAKWTFIFWGLIHALLYVFYFLKGKRKQYKSSTLAEKDSWFQPLKELYRIVRTFCIITISWVYFRSDSIRSGTDYLLRIIEQIGMPSANRFGLIIILLFIIIEWILKKNKTDLALSTNVFVRYTIYFFISFIVLLHFFSIQKEFIYFEF